MIIKKIDPCFNVTSLSESSRCKPQVFRSLLVEKTTCGCVRIVSDVELLLRKQEYLKVHPELMYGFFDNIRPDNPLKKYKDNLTDEDLSKFIKSRRFQTPQELQIYSDYLCDACESESEEFRQAVEEFLSRRDSDVDSGKPDKSDDNVTPSKTE